MQKIMLQNMPLMFRCNNYDTFCNNYANFYLSLGSLPKNSL